VSAANQVYRVTADEKLVPDLAPAEVNLIGCNFPRASGGSNITVQLVFDGGAGVLLMGESIFTTVVREQELSGDDVMTLRDPRRYTAANDGLVVPNQAARVKMEMAGHTNDVWAIMSKQLSPNEVLGGTNFQDKFVMDAIRSEGVVRTHNWKPNSTLDIPLLNLPRTHRSNSKSINSKVAAPRSIRRSVFALAAAILQPVLVSVGESVHVAPGTGAVVPIRAVGEVKLDQNYIFNMDEDLAENWSALGTKFEEGQVDGLDFLSREAATFVYNDDTEPLELISGDVLGSAVPIVADKHAEVYRPGSTVSC
jgi:hypothetical protein